MVLLVIVVGLVLRQGRELHPVHPAAPAAARRRGGGADAVAAVADRGQRGGHLRRLRPAGRRRRWSSSRSSASTSWPPPRRRRRTRRRTVPRGILGSLGDRHRALRRRLAGADGHGATTPSWRRRPAARTSATLATAFTLVGVDWAATIISVGALAGLTTVVMVLMLGQSRVLFAMSPRRAAAAQPRPDGHPRHPGDASRSSSVCSSRCAAGFFPVGELEEMVNIGTLFAFILVSVGTVLPAAQPARPARGPSGAGSAAGGRSSRCSPACG